MSRGDREVSMWAQPLPADGLRRRYEHADGSKNGEFKVEALRPVGGPGGHPPRLPYCIVWTPLPPITWLLPFIGHMGICDSRGAVYDFAGPYSIGVDDMAFSAPARYLVLDPAAAAPEEHFRADALARAGAVAGGVGALTPAGEAAAVWDAAVDAGADVYCRRMHNIFCDNCHSHVARVLSAMRWHGRDDWGMVGLAAWMFFSGRYTSAYAAVQTWAPFVVLVLAIVLWRALV